MSSNNSDSEYDPDDNSGYESNDNNQEVHFDDEEIHDDEQIVFIKTRPSWKRKRIDSEDYTTIENKKNCIILLKQIREQNPNMNIDELVKIFSTKKEPGVKWAMNEIAKIQSSCNKFIRFATIITKLNNIIEKEENENKDEEKEYVKEHDNNQRNSQEIFLNDDMPSILFTLFGVRSNQIETQKNTSTSLTKQDDPISRLHKLFSSITNANEKEDEVLTFFKGLTKEKQEYYLTLINELKIKNNNSSEIPFLLQIAESSIDINTKNTIFDHILNFQKLSSHSSEYNKKKNLIRVIKKLPFDKKSILPMDLKTAMLSYEQHNNKRMKRTNQDMINYLDKISKSMDQVIYGHAETKNQTMRLLASIISNGSAKGGHCFALCGPPGTGKTQIAGEIAKALGRPCVKLNMGGASNGEDLVGHGYTYEGSVPGKIALSMIEANCNDPVMIFDELDKVSKTAKGDEINNILIHITDCVQNMNFQDKYLSGINIDLSNVIMIFSFNDKNNISPILLDRMKIIHVDGYKIDDKINIAKKYLIPSIKQQLGYKNSMYTFDDNILRDLVNQYTFEGGVRKLRELLTDIIMEINLRQMTGQSILNENAFTIKKITKEMIKDDILKDKPFIQHTMVSDTDQIGLVNGLWANSYGVGGLIPIEAHFIPSATQFELKLTGMQGDVMKESMNVAKTVAWRLLPETRRNELLKKWKKTGATGIHIHCPDGSTPKDGPSAGGAITTCLVSVLSDTPVNQSFAMTGEINLKGEITAIGGLEEKIFGAITAGVKTVLYPKENERDAEKIRKKYPDIININSLRYIKLIPVSKIEDILEMVLIKKHV